MHSGRTSKWKMLAIVSASLAIVPAFAAAQPPYVISGLHSELRLDEAVAQAQKLGGDCREIVDRSNEEGESVQCEYRLCDETAATGACNAEDTGTTGLAFAGQAIASILLQAQADTTRLTRIVIVYSGDTDALAAGLIDAFGPTETDGAPTDSKSWSHARRWSWRAGPYRMGLLNSPQWITLATDQAPAVPAGDGAGDNPP
jgi:hypothetical protein